MSWPSVVQCHWVFITLCGCNSAKDCPMPPICYLFFSFTTEPLSPPTRINLLLFSPSCSCQQWSALISGAHWLVPSPPLALHHSIPLSLSIYPSMSLLFSCVSSACPHPGWEAGQETAPQGHRARPHAVQPAAEHAAGGADGLIMTLTVRMASEAITAASKVFARNVPSQRLFNPD